MFLLENREPLALSSENEGTSLFALCLRLFLAFPFMSRQCSFAVADLTLSVALTFTRWGVGNLHSSALCFCSEFLWPHP